MTLKAKLYYLASPRSVRQKTILAMGLLGMVGIMAAVVVTQDSGLILSELGQQVVQSPIGAVVSLIKSIF